jgi:hypothetical protein
MRAPGLHSDMLLQCKYSHTVVLAVAAWTSFASNGVYGASRPYVLLAQPTYFESDIIHFAAV